MHLQSKKTFVGRRQAILKCILEPRLRVSCLQSIWVPGGGMGEAALRRWSAFLLQSQWCYLFSNLSTVCKATAHPRFRWRIRRSLVIPWCERSSGWKVCAFFRENREDRYTRARDSTQAKSLWPAEDCVGPPLVRGYWQRGS